ncbi:MAG: hypothetical protein EXX96DRAFT_617961 [Benjaminiella poitrasii]|nr:MAG: hypothetical protein EXX96DRAFT_617961 [Benjaminiella poitrasii]
MELDLDSTTNVTKGKTAAEFDILIHKWMKRCVEAATLPTLIDIFKPILPELINEIKECHSQGEDYMLQEFKKGISIIVKERQLVEKQNKLDDLISEAEKRDKVQIQLVPTPEQVTNGVIYKSKKDELVRLQDMLDKLTDENYELMNKVREEDVKKQEKISKLETEIDQFNKRI